MILLKQQPNGSFQNNVIYKQRSTTDSNLKCTIKTPADVSVKLQAKAGKYKPSAYPWEDRSCGRDIGDVHLDETLGNYNISVTKG